MKSKNIMTLCALLMALCLCLPAVAGAYEGQKAKAWLNQFAGELAKMQPLNDPQQTVDPARAGEYLLEYEFGTVTVNSVSALDGESILAVDIRTPQAGDWHGIRVGMSVREALGGASVEASSTQLYVLRMLDGGEGWCWAYVDDRGVYGVEYVIYSGDGLDMREYTLTYLIGQEKVTAIRIKAAPATQAQAAEAMSTALEIASRQHGEILAVKNERPMLVYTDMTVMGGAALGAEVAELVMRLGEPRDVQTLPQGGGRILLYDGVVATLNLDEYTGVEVVRGVSVSSEAVTGPRGLSVGMAVQEAASLFRCDQDVSSLGGVLYLEGEALGEAPFGELRASGMGDVTLLYACLTPKGEEALLEMSVQDGAVANWQMYFGHDREGGV